jgi:hypothetical protein
MAEARGNLFRRSDHTSTCGCKLAEQPGFSGFNTAAVQSDYRCACGTGDLNERAQKSRLPDSRNSMEVHHNGSFMGQNIVQ